jgi:hypothetical protein
MRVKLDDIMLAFCLATSIFGLSAMSVKVVENYLEAKRALSSQLVSTPAHNLSKRISAQAQPVLLTMPPPG